MNRPALSLEPRRLTVLSVTFAAVLVSLLGCAQPGTAQEGAGARATAAPTASGTSSQTQPGEVLATIDGEVLTLADLDDLIGDELATLEVTYGTQRYQLLQAGLEQAIRQRLIEAEAERQGTTYDELLAARLGDISVSEAEVANWYQANQARLQGRPLEMLRPAIRQFLVEQQQESVLSDLAAELSDGREVEVHLEPFRVDVATAGHPSWGPEDAAVTLVEFSDFECPYCGGFTQTLQQIKNDYEGRIRVVYRQFPLTQIHPNAMKAAEASLCAAEQDRFWPLHDLLFADQQGLGVAQLREKARQVGVDGGAFDACLDSGKYLEQIEGDLQAGSRLGVTGTPAVFINGRPLEGGAVGYEVIAELLDDELESAR